MFITKLTFRNYKIEKDREVKHAIEDAQREKYQHKHDTSEEYREYKKAKDFEIVQLNEEHKLLEKKLVSAYDDKLQKNEASLKSEYEAELAKIKAEHLKDKHEFMETHLNKNYDKLSTSLQSLHEKGNSTTEFISKYALQMNQNQADLQAKMMVNANTTNTQIGIDRIPTKVQVVD